MKKIFLVAITLSLSAFTLVRCAPPSVKGSNSKLSSKEARALLEDRLDQTARVRLELDRIRDGLEPVTAALSKLDAAIRASLEGKDAPELRRLIKKLQESLRAATEGVVEHGRDGSWAIEREIKLDVDEDGSCATARMRIEGKHVLVGEQLTVRVQNCRTQAPTEAATILILRDGESKMSFYPDALQTLLPREKVRFDSRSEKCDFHLDTKETFLYCQNLASTSVSGTSFRFGSLLFTKNEELSSLSSLFIMDAPDAYVTMELKSELPGKTQVKICAWREEDKDGECTEWAPVNVPVAKAVEGVEGHVR